MEQSMWKHLKKEERIQIQTLLDVGKRTEEISKYLGRHRSTIYREMQRLGVNDERYDANVYHKQSRLNMVRQPSTEPSEETILFIEKKILEEQWSPEQISNWLKANSQATVSHVWIYKYISEDKKSGGELYNHMRRGGSYNKEPREYKGKIPNRISIEERPEIVNTRERLGDYEIDLIVGPQNKGAILTIIDRTSRECILKKLSGKLAVEVAATVVNSITDKAAYTITSDNGTEFTNHECIAGALNLKYFFAHPYASYERGSIENLNGLVRQYIPKGMSFDNVDDNMLKSIETKLNNRPRKTLDYFTPIEYSKNYHNTDKKLDLSHLQI